MLGIVPWEGVCAINTELNNTAEYPYLDVL